MVGELRNIRVQVGSDPRILTNIGIQVADIPETYGMLLSRDLMKSLGGYLSLNFSHMWLPWRGIPTQIRIESEPRLKHIIIEYDFPNEVAFFKIEMGVYKREEIITFLVLNAKDMSKQKFPNPLINENQCSLIRKLQQDKLILGEDTDLQILLLPNWCRVHYQNHFESTCQPCIDTLNYVPQAEKISLRNFEKAANHFPFEAQEATMLIRDRMPSKGVLS